MGRHGLIMTVGMGWKCAVVELCKQRGTEQIPSANACDKREETRALAACACACAYLEV